ncbi:twitch domain-containing radical SAM protein [Rhizobium laguerreae]|uniref:twitch domain-containing radical SAM protein n=1 Tax=Rhizobium laguerreae TaxID=1076926 RepID=UPI001C929706|nr:twitch domain-containing radical SAM protein [Rhizobium laguerreae]MBY3348008.1 twitch domain-containing radical SAM protein [Rhizobium laguerreae]MBY3354971.1 twitch domain-containing radical SAM protein [Rhizobium laguerreae]MBY3376276.1 twitch domain-containing radical SAM protein [Rhizobium laguerreae]MBY3431275.1 twitch domain-containing radical SAM protein [Rhizobium laguerreae]MBY3439890.1 twitch domain-containing radical SAM protein [Rhizobium laguerreae]
MSVPGNLCLMPWLHAHVDAQGVRGLCAVDLGRFEIDDDKMGTSLQDYWNSESMRTVRRQMLSDELPHRCRLCKGDGNRAQSLKDEINERWKEWLPHAVSETDASGSTTLTPFSFDYRNSICNLKCRICGPRSSTALEAEARSNDAIGRIEAHVGAWDRTYQVRRGHAIKASLLELQEAVASGTIRHLYWAGGEPLFDDTHWKIMQALVESGQAGNVDVVYNTNLTMLSFKGKSVEELWPSFRSVHVQASVDGLGACGEFIRKGFQTEVFIRHVDALIALSRNNPTIHLSFDITLTSVGLLYLGDLLEFALRRRVRLTAKLMKPRDQNYYLALEALPTEVSRDWSGRWMTWIAAHDTDDLLGAVYDTLLHHLRHRSEPDQDLLSTSRDTLAAFDQVRGEAGIFRHLCAIDDRLVLFPG